MKIAITAQQGLPESPVDPRFGRAKYFVIYDDVAQSYEAVDNVQNVQAAQGAGIQAASTIVNAGCSVLISGHCGPKAFAALDRANVKIYTVSKGTVKETVDSFKNNALKQIVTADVDGHW
jgi:predicted Fe-Mo cluster-binding NifX family protein